MTRLINTVLFAILLCLTYLCQAQYDIRIRVSDIKCDSIQIQSFDWKSRQGIGLVQSQQPEIVFKGKVSLKPGMYWICADTNHIAPLVISAERKQKTTVSITKDTVIYTNNPESSNYLSYQRQKEKYAQAFNQLDVEYQNTQRLPAFMIQPAVDSLIIKARKLQKEEFDFNTTFMESHKGSLAANLILASMPTPTLPQSYYGNPQKIQEFIIQHYFDEFPWDDPRVFNSPLTEEKIQNYCEFIYQVDRPDLDTFVIQTLKSASINETSLLGFFEKLDLKIGRYMSNYKVEHTYIKMLQYILTCPNVPKVRRIFYERELEIINKNLDGNIATNFNLVLSTGDTTTLHDIKSDYTLLFLHNPTCTTCREVRRRIANYELLNEAIAKGKLKVLTVYMEKDEKVWKNYIQNEASPNYIHGWNYDQAIEEKELYETRTIPYMFLLDKDKRIIRKNILYNEIESYIQLLQINK